MISRLDLELIARRTGWLPWVSAALVVAALCVLLLGTAKLAGAIDERVRDLAQFRETAARPGAAVAAERPLIEQRLEAFNAVLGDKRELNKSVAVLFAEAGKQGLTLAQAEYRLEYNKPGAFHAYKLTLPVRGPYPALRRFVDATLQSVPYAALDNIIVKRDGIGSPETEVKLRFVFYLKDAAP